MKRRYLFVLVVIISSFVYSQKATTLKQLIQPKNIHKEAGKSEVQIFDLKGTLLEKSMIPIKEKNAKRFFPYDIKKGMLYQLVENEDEEWELHVTKIH